MSLRGRGLHVLRLRGPLVVDGEDEDEVALEPGLVLQLSPRSRLQVVSMDLPTHVLALQDAAGRALELAARVASLHVRDGIDLVAGLRDDAPARVWSDGEGWRMQTGSDAPVRLVAGQTWTVDGSPVRVIRLPIADAVTTATAGGPREPITLVARFTSCHILRPRRHTVVIDGQPGRALSELVAMRAPIEWRVLASVLWPEEEAGGDRERLRRRWDRVFARLRQKLREAGVRETLVRADGAGNVELVLLPGDRLIDET